MGEPHATLARYNSTIHGRTQDYKKARTFSRNPLETGTSLTRTLATLTQLRLEHPPRRHES